ncbi:peptidoglycan-binding domain-containing protein, partial [Streptomyces sp. T-3]|nr:peptidoglycan-binding domain-containing protein [Streptomyces sp. T-3]
MITRKSFAAVAAAALLGSGFALTTSTSAQAAPGVVTIAWGSSNTAGVKCVQQALNYVGGAGLAVDGDFKTKTDTAVRNFQTFFKLTVDGKVGKNTGDMLWFTVDRKAGHAAWKSGGCWNVVPSSS